MHIPAYAWVMIRSAMPMVPTSRQVAALDCCLCDQPFDGRAAVPLGPTPATGLFGCRDCLTRLVKRARQLRDSALVQEADLAHAQAAAWSATRLRHLASLEHVRRAAEAVTGLAEDDGVEPLDVAWLLVSLESARAWTTEDAPRPPGSEPVDEELREAGFRISLEMISAREAVARRLVYHLINEAALPEPEACAEMECPESCFGRHDWEHIDCGPDAVFEDLACRGIELERTDDLLPPRRRPSVEEEPPLTGFDGDPDELVDKYGQVLAYFGLDHENTEVLVDAAAVGLVADVWRNGPLDATHAAGTGPSDGEIFAQSVDLYRAARAALLSARDGGPEELLVFQAIASDVRLRWAGGSSFTLLACGEPTDEFCQDIDNRLWFTGKQMKELGWRTSLMHRAMSAVVKTPGHFGMPGWPAVAATALRRIDTLDRTDAPGTLHDLAAVEVALREAPDRLGADALDWLCRRGVFAPEVGVPR
ncbi:hypothetical protein ACIF6L_07490 [Kitasatospora sp. NPDC086009]|uniref:hypothetical protein n=1 Tax=unclassified Kitasatospora TaxID=2633591 RepID=UPI0037CB4F6C